MRWTLDTPEGLQAAVIGVLCGSADSAEDAIANTFQKAVAGGGIPVAIANWGVLNPFVIATLEAEFRTGVRF